MPLRPLKPKPGAPVINSGDFLAFLNERGVHVEGDTVIAHSDGSVEVDTLASTSLDAAWDAYQQPAPAPPTPTVRAQLIAELDAVKNPAELVPFLRDRLIPALVPDV